MSDATPWGRSRSVASRCTPSRAVSRPPQLEDLAVWHRADLAPPPGRRGGRDRRGPAHPPSAPGLVYGARRPWGSLENVRWVEASLLLLRHFAAAGGRRAVVAGTCAEYDWSRSPLSEAESPLVPATLYGAAKRGLRVVAEPLCSARRLRARLGPDLLSELPPRGPPPAGRLVARALARGEPAPSSHGRQLRDFLHVEDLADALPLSWPTT